MASSSCAEGFVAGAPPGALVGGDSRTRLHVTVIVPSAFIFKVGFCWKVLGIDTLVKSLKYPVADTVMPLASCFTDGFTQPWIPCEDLTKFSSAPRASLVALAGYVTDAVTFPLPSGLIQYSCLVWQPAKASSIRTATN